MASWVFLCIRCCCIYDVFDDAFISLTGFGKLVDAEDFLTSGLIGGFVCGRDSGCQGKDSIWLAGGVGWGGRVGDN